MEIVERVQGSNGGKKEEEWRLENDTEEENKCVEDDDGEDALSIDSCIQAAVEQYGDHEENDKIALQDTMAILLQDEIDMILRQEEGEHQSKRASDEEDNMLLTISQIEDLKKECSMYQLRASMAESRLEDMQERLDEALEKLQDAQERLIEATTSRERAVSELSTRQSLEDVLSSYQGHQQRNENSLADAQRCETLMSELESVRRENEFHRDTINDLERRLKLSETFNETARADHDLAIQKLKAQTQETTMKRKAMEMERDKERQTYIDDLECKMTESNAARKSSEQTLEHLLNEHNQLIENFENTQMELARIKVDLATRRSGEDDLITRLELLHQESESNISTAQGGVWSWFFNKKATHQN